LIIHSALYYTDSSNSEYKWKEETEIAENFIKRDKASLTGL